MQQELGAKRSSWVAIQPFTDPDFRLFLQLKHWFEVGGVARLSGTEECRSNALVDGHPPANSGIGLPEGISY